ncbi:MAG: hypothetical protein JXQ75_01690 [Phycisphaerae bacterium]|nr:hypothetical protein [Phycisphaerae bacterium]
MIALFKHVVLSQMECALHTLGQCIRNCPQNEWNESHGDYPFCQVVFHALFFTDLYLERDESLFRAQRFHRNNEAFFQDYEELEWKEAKNLYERSKCAEYLSHCLAKCVTTLQMDDEHTLRGPSGFSSKTFSRAELYVECIRHVQHHAAQLGLRIQRIAGIELKWMGSASQEHQ